ncbi:hypothetical protein KSF_000250 [Reticulibacter mediterranei]|uniref:Anaphase-promoting complex subunit 4 WD40 domain-containing protein n=1 Tax=Reticulibacter mediterranei TaxID=2778369 RepID=A0A8J3MXM3_9CHLR|nr:hypothetical protein [Reticulibacter mediterranei]GHO89977.1 hypothetical protein KSF_000250 [Reticulibacter mediterranei]
MSDYFDPLSPQRVDESIEEMTASKHPLESPHLLLDPSARVIRDVQQMHDHEYQKHQQQLQRVEKRLLASVAHRQNQQARTPIHPMKQERQEQQRNREQGSLYRMKKQYVSNWRGLSLLVAVLLIALVGSFLAMPKFLHHDTLTGSSDQTAAPPPSPTPTPPLVIPGASSGKTVYTSPATQNGFTALAWSPDGQRVISSAFEKVQIWDATTGGHLINVNLAGDQAYSLAWSPTGKLIAIGSFTGLLLVDSQTGKIVRTHQATTAIMQRTSTGTYLSALKPASGGTGFRAITWSPDGRLIAGAVSAGASGSIQVINAQTMTPAFTFPIDGNYVPTELAWSDDGHYLAATTFFTEPGNAAPQPTLIRVWKLATHQIIFQKPIGLGSNISLAFQPGHDSLTFLNPSTQALEIWDVVTGKLIKSYPATGNGPLAWSPDGHYLAYSQWSKKGINIVDMSSGKTVYTYRAYQTMPSPLTWSPNGKYIAFVDESPQTGAQGQPSSSKAVVKVCLVA